jgi:hypothetical protein
MIKKIPVSRCLAALALFIAIFYIIQYLRLTYPTPPLQVPIRLDQKGIVADLNFEITELWYYVFYIRFSFHENDMNDRERVKEIIGNNMPLRGRKGFHPGILTPVKLSIFKEEQQSWVLMHEKKITPTLTSWGGGDFSKNITGIRLPPGKYRAVLESFSQPIEYATIPTQFGIGLFRYGK